jgi:hypothetical protein
MNANGPTPTAVARALDVLAAELHKRNPAVSYLPALSPGDAEASPHVGELDASRGNGRRVDDDARE